MRHEVSTPIRAEIDSAKTLEQIAHRANQAHALAMVSTRNAVQHALTAGQALLQAKELCPKGSWGKWLADHFDGSERTAQAYMRVATHRHQLGGDPLRAAEASRRAIERMVAGLPASDGRCRPKRRLTDLKTESAAAGSDADVGQPASSDASGSSPGSSPETDIGFARVARLLGQAVEELQRLAEHDRSGDASYAGHLLARLRLLRDGLPRTRWFHQWKIGPDWR